jgi:AcrR family transcriptional regulator
MPKNLKRLSFSEREKKILDAATDLFSKKGFEGTTTKAIALKAGVNEARLFRHFSNKEKLYAALLRRKVSHLFLHVIPVLEKMLDQPLSEALFKIAKTFVEEHQRDPQIFRMMLYSALEDHHLSALFFKGRLPFAELLERLLTERMAKGEILKQDSTILIRAFLALIQNYILMTQIFKAKNLFPKSENEVIQDFVDLFVRGIKA